MDVNILKRKNLVSIYLIYKDFCIRQVKVNLHFIDDEECYFETDLWENITKPNNNQSVEILACTKNGVYKAKTKLVDTSISMRKIMYTLKVPKKWEYSQMRTSIRKTVALPFVLKFNDEFELNGNTVDISTGGVSFTISEQIMPLNYTTSSAEISINLSDDEISKDENMCIKSDVKFLREYTADYITTYVYKFIRMDSHSINLLKLFVNKL